MKVTFDCYCCFVDRFALGSVSGMEHHDDGSFCLCSVSVVNVNFKMLYWQSERQAIPTIQTINMPHIAAEPHQVSRKQTLSNALIMSLIQSSSHLY